MSDPSMTVDGLIAKRLRSDAAQLVRMAEAATFGDELSVRVKSPDLLISSLLDAADEIERLTRERDAATLDAAIKQAFFEIEAAKHVEWLENYMGANDRALTAEARIAVLEAALEKIETLGSDGEHSGDRHARCRLIARNALVKA